MVIIKRLNLTWLQKLVLGMLLLALLVASATIFTLQSVNAQTSQLKQEVVLVGCDNTTYLTGLGNVHDPACPVFSPVISSYERTADGRFLVYGAYDAIHTDISPSTNMHRLTILFAGRTFRLGVDPELSVDGNAWMLDVADWREDVTAEEASENQTQSVIRTVVTTIGKSQPESSRSQSLAGEATITAPNRQLDMTQVDQGPLTDGKKTTEEGPRAHSEGISPWLFWLTLMLLIGETAYLWLFMSRRRAAEAKERNSIQ